MEEFPQEMKVVHQAVLLGQHSITISYLLELLAAFGKWHVSLKGLLVLVNMQFFRSVLTSFGLLQKGAAHSGALRSTWRVGNLTCFMSSFQTPLC